VLSALSLDGLIHRQVEIRAKQKLMVSLSNHEAISPPASAAWNPGESPIRSRTKQGCSRRRGLIGGANLEIALNGNVGNEPDRQRAAGSVDDSGMVMAALDLGTNNCRLLVARPRGESFRVVDAFSRIVRLGEGVGASGALSAAAMDRTIEALKVCAGKMRRHHVTHARSVATEACRRAGNCEDFIARARQETGIEIEIISNHEEASLAFSGCAPLLASQPSRAIVFDIGGGSTEVGCLDVSAAGPARLAAWHSIPVGVVTLAERHGTDRISPEVYEAMVQEVRSLLGEFEAAENLLPAVSAGQMQMLGTSGTVTTLSGVHLDLPRYDRSVVDGSYLDFATIDRVSADLAAMSWDGRAAIPCIGRERADLVVAGCAILAAICRIWPVGRLRVADRGVREGILFGLLANGAEPRRPQP
jgi:exopolyphosphatase / guanosine-5'-triphosphate,3'-diphosphate pyrophosphatase